MTNQNHAFTTRKRRLGGDEELAYGTAVDWASEIVDSSGIQTESGKVIPANELSVSDGLIHHYTFDDGTADDQVGSADGSVSGATHLSDGGPQGDGAYDFDGEDDYIQTGVTSLPTPLSVSAWVNLNSTDSHFIGQYSGGGNDWYFKIQSGSFRIMDDSVGATDGTTSVSTGQYHHVAWVRGDTYSTLYVDGGEEGSQTGLSQNTFDANNLVIGALDEGGSGLYHDGKVDNVRVYNRSLEMGEIEAIWKAERA